MIFAAPAFGVLAALAATTIEWWMHPIFVGLIVGLPTTAFGVLAYRRTTRQDKAAAQAAVLASHEAALELVIDGLDRLVENLQTDNKEVRVQAADLKARLAECREAYAELKKLTGE